MVKTDKGWDWFEAGNSSVADESEREEANRTLAVAFARCFQGAEGKQALDYLRTITVERILGPNASDAMLRHAEGQRQLVAHITQLVDRGRTV